MANELQSELRLTKHTELIKNEDSPINAATVAADFGKSFVQSAAIEPLWNGVGQLVSGGNLPRVSIVNEANAQKSEASAWAQKFGSAVGIAADFVVLTRGKKALFGGPAAEAIAAMPFTERAILHATDGAKLGAVYGAVFTPSDPKENLLWGRVANAGSQALTFGLMNYTAEALGSAKILQNIKPGTSAMVWKDMSVAGLAGIPAGAAGVVADSALHGRELKLSNIGNAATDYAIIGFALAGLNHGVGALKAADANGITTARHMTDKMGITSPPEFAGRQAEFRIVDGKNDFGSFYNNRLASPNPVETTIQVQQKLHGAFSGIFGERFASYGETRPLTLRHGTEYTPVPGMAGSFGLIATCEPLAPQFRANDVFPARSNASANDRTVWLQPKGEGNLLLSMGERLLGKGLRAEAVPLGLLPRLEHVDARTIKPGETLDTSPQVKFTRDAEGKLWAEPKTGIEGIWTQLKMGTETQIQFGDKVFNSDKLINPLQIKAATEIFGSSAMIGNVQFRTTGDGTLYVKAPVGVERIYLKAEAGKPVEINPSAKFIHLGNDGLLPITNELVIVPKPKAEAPIVDPAKPENPLALPGDPLAPPALEKVDPLIPEAPVKRIDLIEPAPPAAPRERPVVTQPVEDLGTLGSRLTGKAIDPKDPQFRFGKFGEVVLDTARGGIDAGDGTIRPIFSDYDAALAAGRFTTGIFKRRLQTDPKDRDTAPSMKVTVDEFQDPTGASMFVPVIDIKRVGAGRLVLGDNLRPLGIQNSVNLITIEQK